MPSELDNALNGVIAALTAPGAPLETVEIERFGRHLPMLKNAPPSLAHYFAHYCAQHGEAEFIVDGQIRLTFNQIYAAARTVAGGLAASPAHGASETQPANKPFSVPPRLMTTPKRLSV